MKKHLEGLSVDAQEVLGHAARAYTHEPCAIWDSGNLIL